jgi:sn-glycerol 3-phosphate transport system permease protein
MIKRVIFRNRYLPYLLVAPQILITLIFFYWPALRGLMLSFTLTDPFGLKTQFVWFQNFIELFSSPEYRDSLVTTFVFSFLTMLVSLVLGLLFAVGANKIVRGLGFLKTLLILPYAVAPALAGILWLFLFHPTMGVLSYAIRWLGYDWNPLLHGNEAMALVIIAAAWKEASYNFVFFLAGLQSIPPPMYEAAAVDGAGRWESFRYITFPLLTPTSFFLMVINLVYAFFDTFGIIHAVTKGGPGGYTNTLIYKVFADGFIGLNLGASSAQSVVLMVIVISLTWVQFRYLEQNVQYQMV